MERTVLRFSVTSSPTSPSPRVAPLTNTPSIYSRATERPSILYFDAASAFENAVIESGYGIKDWTNWDDMYAFLPGVDLEFFLNTDDDNGNDYFENYDENVKKALVSAEAHLNEFLADSSIIFGFTN